MDAEDSEFEQTYKDEVKDIVLPKWLTDEFPKHLPHAVISFRADGFYANEDGPYENIVEAYEYVTSMRDRYQAVFDASVDGHGGKISGNGFFCNPDTDNGRVRLLVSITSEDIEDILKHDYLEWLTVVSIDYNMDPEDFVKAHKFLSHHPMFWVKGTKEKSFQWATDLGLDNMSINVWADEETGKPVVFLEHGQHHEDGYTYFYRDVRIFVQEETFEKAIIAMAAKVNAVFDLDGNERAVEGSEPGE
jgi:hypothetical protein